jgi:hypothetical protein
LNLQIKQFVKQQYDSSTQFITIFEKSDVVNSELKIPSFIKNKKEIMDRYTHAIQFQNNLSECKSLLPNKLYKEIMMTIDHYIKNKTYVSSGSIKIDIDENDEKNNILVDAIRDTGCVITVYDDIKWLPKVCLNGYRRSA